MRLPFFRKAADTPPEPKRPGRARAERARSEPFDGGAAEVDQARTRARRRLVGALVLLAVGVIGFPLVFETQPRPLPVDIPIRMPAGGGVAAATGAPAPGLRPLPVTALPAEAGSEISPGSEAPASAPAERSPADRAVAIAALPAEPTPAPVSAPVPATPLAPPPVTAPVPTPAAAKASAPPAVAARPAAAAASKPSAKPAVAPAATDGARAAALLAGGGAGASAPAAAGRFVVQVGAYTDARMLKETRSKVEKLGLQTYTQVVENDGGKRTRVRLGPYATRDEAEAAAAKLKRAGLPGNILAL